MVLKKTPKTKTGNYTYQLRTSLNETMKQFSKRFEVTEATITRWENGITIPNIKHSREIAKTLNISVNEFLGAEWRTDLENIEDEWE
ncbi:hypothetical protein BKX95_10010 [Streptococcus iniae]|nr:hypothetical protein BKX95_10010 [Streptococcus iniae]